MKKYTSIILLFLLCSLANAQLKNDYKGRKTRILFLLDGSGSMVAAMGETTRWAAAIQLMSEMIDSVRSIPDLEVGLRVFGHNIPITQKDCYDTKLEVPFGPNNHKLFKNALFRVKPLGYTSITQSLLACAKDFPEDKKARNVIVLITDGVEECEGDPCKVSAEMQKKGIILKPFIIGLGSDNEKFKLIYNCAGKYFNAQSKDEFGKIIGLIITSILNSTSAQISLLDNQDKPTETNVPMTIYNASSGKILETWVHTLNGKTNPDTIFLDPANKYDITVHTTPQIILKDIEIEGGKHNTIAIPAAQGDLNLKIGGITKYGLLQALITDKKTGNRVSIQEYNTIKRMLIGDYSLEILTTPVTFIDNVNIKQNRTTTVEIASPGKLQLTKSTDLVVAIYQIKNDIRVWVADVPYNAGKYDLVMQPGQYQIVYRTKNETRTLYTKVKDFTINTQASTFLNI